MNTLVSALALALAIASSVLYVQLRRTSTELASARTAAELSARDFERAQQRVQRAEQALSEEADRHERDNNQLRADVASGARRLRVAIARCEVPAPSATSVGDDAPAFGTIRPDVAEGLVSIAGVCQREVNKLRMLQAYVCAVRPETGGC